MDKVILVKTGEVAEFECESVILIPERAIAEPGHIKVYTVKDSAHAKHEYHAMAQMAYFQFQDDELRIQEVDSPIVIITASEEMRLEQGMLLCRAADGSFTVFVHAMQNRKKLLETGYRFCTRWIRLDI